MEVGTVGEAAVLGDILVRPVPMVREDLFGLLDAQVGHPVGVFLILDRKSTRLNSSHL